MIDLSRAEDTYIIYVGRLVVDYHPSWLNIIFCGRLLAMLHDIHLQQTISTKADDTHLTGTTFIQSRRYSSDGNDIHSRETNIIYDG
jgi:hypothetical protein